MAERGHRPSLADEIEALTDLQDHLGAIDRIVASYLPAERRQAFAERSGAITRRAEDPRLNLAVAGEFSAGKSTFINALLRTRLLKASVVATTASLTRLHCGAELAVTATFGDGARVRATADSFEDLRQAVAGRQPLAAKDESLKALLDRLTSDGKVADEVRHLDVEVPNELVAADVVVFDSPGIGAGDAGARGHARLTERLLAEVADCVLVLVPAATPLTNTLLEFMQGHLPPFLHRCVFLVTALDRQDDSEQAATLEFVRAKLQEKLGLAEPVVFGISSIAMLPASSVGASPSATEWQTRFREVEAFVAAKLRRERTLIIAEHLVRLLRELVGELERSLAEIGSSLQAEAALLQANPVGVLEVVLRELGERSTRELQECGRQLHGRIRELEGAFGLAAKQEAYATVERAGFEIRSYQESLHPVVQASVGRGSQSYVAAVNYELGALVTRGRQLAGIFAERFEASYAGLRSRGVAVPAPAVAIAPLPDAQAFSRLLDHVGRQAAEDHQRAQAGGCLGSLVGSLTLIWFTAPAGAVFGLLFGLSVSAEAGCFCFLVGAVAGLLAPPILGNWAGQALASSTGKSLMERQQDLRRLLELVIDKVFDELRQGFDRHLDQAVAGMSASFVEAIGRHQEEHRSAVEVLRREHDEKQRGLAERIAAVRGESADLGQRANRLAAMGRRLTTARAPGGQEKAG